MDDDSFPYRIDDRDWASLTTGQQIRQVEEDGYLIVPDHITPEHLVRLREACSRLETTGRDYSERQRGCKFVHLQEGILAELIGYGPTVRYLRMLFGD